MSNQQQPTRMWSGRFRNTLAPVGPVNLYRILRTIVFCSYVSVQRSSALFTRCSQRKINRLEAEFDGIREWSKLRAFYHRYRACQVEDAEVQEGASESVARMLADHWNTLPAVSMLFKQDPAFEAFVLASINITDLTDDLNRIDKLATESCPVNLTVLCRKIRRSIRDNN